VPTTLSMFCLPARYGPTTAICGAGPTLHSLRTCRTQTQLQQRQLDALEPVLQQALAAQQSQLQQQAAAAAVAASQLGRAASQPHACQAASSQPAADVPQLASQLASALSSGLQPGGCGAETSGSPAAATPAPPQSDSSQPPRGISDVLSDVDDPSAANSAQSWPDVAQQPWPAQRQEESGQEPWAQVRQHQAWPGAAHQPWAETDTRSLPTADVLPTAKENLVAEDRARSGVSSAALPFSRPPQPAAQQPDGSGVGSPDVFADLFGMTTLDDYGRLVNTAAQQPKGPLP